MNYYLTQALILLLYTTLWFAVSLVKKRNDVADIAWGLGFVLLSWSSLFYSQVFSVKALVVCILISIWGIRLASHIYRRHKGKPEDSRYLIWRKEWGKWFTLRSYLQVFLLQGFFLFLIIQPALLINNSHAEPGLLDILGVAVWVIGFYFESAADLQLKNFLADPKNRGHLMDRGLWKYSRHPNYFGEVTQWWGIWILAASIPGGILTIIGPLTITWLILFVSGIPMLEKKYSGRPDFEEYKKRTSVFIPWFTKTALPKHIG